MKGAMVILLLIALFPNSSIAGPMDRPQLTPQPDIQTEAVEATGPSDESQNEIDQSAGLRMKRETFIVSKTPDRFCTGCFSVIGDPTRPQ